MVAERLLNQVEAEIERGSKKWGHVDQTPVDFISAATEELGEVAHAINHNEGIERAQQEIAEVIGILCRLWRLLEG